MSSYPQISFQENGYNYTFRAEAPAMKETLSYQLCLLLPAITGLLLGTAVTEFKFDSLVPMMVGLALGGSSGFTYAYFKNKKIAAFNEACSKGEICRVIQFYQSKFPKCPAVVTEREFDVRAS